jgi:hypothetical protein
MVNGRAKGNKYENDICFALSKWLAPQYTPDTASVYDLPFRRRSTSIMPSEGHWNGTGDILHKPLSGIVCPFSIECKKRESWELDGMFNGEKWPVWQWWQQAGEQAEKGGLVPLMIFSRNRRENLVMLYERDALCLGVSPATGPLVRVERPRDVLKPPVVIVSLPSLVTVSLTAVVELANKNTRQQKSISRTSRGSSGKS